MNPAELGYRFGQDSGLSILLLRAAMFEMPMDPTAQATLMRGVDADFPIRPADLMPDYAGPALGAALKQLEKRWIRSDLTMTRAELLTSLAG
jgi:poly(A) polymerase